MKLIVYKRDIEYFLNNFKNIASYDNTGQKFYFVFEDNKRKGKWTLMYYENEGKWTKHGKGENYCDIGETQYDKEKLIDFIYKNRKYINNTLREVKKIQNVV